MPMQFLCPQGHLLAGEPSQAGQPCKCPYCGIEFVIPNLLPAGGAESFPPQRIGEVRMPDFQPPPGIAHPATPRFGEPALPPFQPPPGSHPMAPGPWPRSRWPPWRRWLPWPPSCRKHPWDTPCRRSRPRRRCRVCPSRCGRLSSCRRRPCHRRWRRPGGLRPSICLPRSRCPTWQCRPQGQPSRPRPSPPCSPAASLCPSIRGPRRRCRSSCRRTPTPR